MNRPGNSVFSTGGSCFDDLIALCRRAGFTDILLRGDSDFSRVSVDFDRWTADGVRFVFGYKGWEGIVNRANEQPDNVYASWPPEPNARSRHPTNKT